MMDFTGASSGGGFGSAIGQGGPLTPQGIIQLLRLLGGKRNTQDLVPGASFPGYDAQGNDISGGEDPYQYANSAFPKTQTPGINPGAQTPQVQQGGGGIGGILGGIFGRGGSPTGTPSPAGPGGWQQYLPYAVGGAASVVGSVLQNRSNNQQNKRLEQRATMNDELARQEQAKRDYYASMLLPSMLQALGNKDPKLAAMLLKQRQMQPGYGQG